ncbi:MAG: Crp/Fnr family transcriptional regulator [Chitinophagales bacterium]
MSSEQDFTTNLIASLYKIAEEKVIAKGEFLIREGEVERNLYFIETGAVRAFYLSEFDEQTIRLGYAGSFINSLASFIKGTPSEFYIEAIRKTRIKSITRESFLSIVNENEESRQQYIRLLELLVTQLIDREIDLLTFSPVERLNRVLQRSPHLFQQIPLKYIASYLRMKPETLSRIRNS